MEIIVQFPGNIGLKVDESRIRYVCNVHLGVK